MAKKIKTTLGGDRLGSGNRQKIEMHNYFRSNHNLSCTRISSMSPGALYPMYTQIGLAGDTFDFDLSAFVRTLPTEGPLFGAFKLQVDVFSADLRLYQAVLHNNTTEIGYYMDQVLLPKVELSSQAEQNTQMGEFDTSSLMYYLGMAGIGRLSVGMSSQVTKRKVNAVPMLAYYDIYKNYYANKQEENAYVITSGESITNFNNNATSVSFALESNEYETTFTNSITEGYYMLTINSLDNMNILVPNMITIINGAYSKPLQIITYLEETGTPINLNKFIFTQSNNNLVIEYVGDESYTFDNIVLLFETNTNVTTGKGSIRLQEFPLKNIDLMRKRLLTSWDLGEEIVIDDTETLMPYLSVVGTHENEKGEELSKNCYPMQGLAIKCYQSDLFNNWLDNEYVALIQEKSNVNVTNGQFSIDALNFAKKLYNHYNRIAVTGGTYDDWQKAAYGMVHYGKAEKPIYHGGMSSEVIFDEVVSSVATADEPLGSLGGRGSLKGSRGGHVIVKCNEACVIMVMVSLTPRVSYSQGNAWYLTELDSMNDLHQPDFDRIGFQDLMTEQMAWFDTQVHPTTGELTRTSVGKQPSWIQYQTDIDKCYGDFAKKDGKGFMVLQRLYDQAQGGGVKDITTYIDPTKYNYAFAVDDLTAQNFWVFLNCKCFVRRLMSAKQMPNV